jgi:hypothetical protein
VLFTPPLFPPAELLVTTGLLDELLDEELLDELLLKDRAALSKELLPFELADAVANTFFTNELKLLVLLE